MDSINQPTKSNHVKLTLETLPPEIKNEIFSHLLLAAKVKYSTNGLWPGHKYKFDAALMRVSKQMKMDATTYLNSHNKFALISTKYFAIEIDRKRFSPVVATGKAARTFKTPAIEATITHVGATLCSCCNPQKHDAKDRATHALFLVADLKHLMRELRLTYHIWPSKPIYAISKPGVSPVKHIPLGVDTQVKVVWKVNPSHRQDLSVAERRSRQVRLLAPIDFPTGSAKTISVIGVDKDISRKVTDANMPRILSIDAVGWDLYNLLKAQKQHLDTILSQDPSSFSHLIYSYTDLACMGWQLDMQGDWRSATVTTLVRMPGTIVVSLCLMAFRGLDDEEYEAACADSWQIAVVSLVLDCLFTVLRLGLEDETFGQMMSFIRSISKMMMQDLPMPMKCQLHSRFSVLLGHHSTWLMCQEKASRSTVADAVLVKGKEKLEAFMQTMPVEDRDETWFAINEDWEFMSRVVAGQVTAWTSDFGCFKVPCVNFQGLLNRSRILNTDVQPTPPRETFKGWTTKTIFPEAEDAARMIKFADDFYKTEPAQRNKKWAAHRELDDDHIAATFMNLPREGDEEEEDFAETVFFSEVNGVAMLGDMSMFMPGGVLPGEIFPGGVFPGDVLPF